MKAIILAAGTGSRLAPIGVTIPKLLVPVAGLTILEHQVLAIEALVDEIVVVVGPSAFGSQISAFIANKTWSLPISTVVQEQPLGTADAFQAAAEKTKTADRLLFLLGDDLYSKHDLTRLASYPLAVLGKTVEDWQKWGILQTTSTGLLTRIMEKPEEFVGNVANTGAAVLSPRVFELYEQLQPSVRGELEFTDSMSLLAAEEPVMVSPVEDYWLPVGYPWHILDAQEQLGFDQGCVSDGVVIGESSVVLHSTVMAGTGIGQGCSLEYSVVGPECQIGNNITVEVEDTQGGTIKSDIKGVMTDSGRTKLGVILGQGVKVGDGVRFSAGVKVWPGVTIEDGAVVTEDRH